MEVIDDLDLFVFDKVLLLLIEIKKVGILFGEYSIDSELNVSVVLLFNSWNEFVSNHFPGLKTTHLEYLGSSVID